MGSEDYFTLKEFQLGNNCPECYNNEGLKLTIRWVSFSIKKNY